MLSEKNLPLKKRRLHFINKREEEEEKKNDYEQVQSYPATPMLSIADALEFFNSTDFCKSPNRFKTPAERKEVPPLAYITNDYYIFPKNYAEEYLFS